MLVFMRGRPSAYKATALVTTIVDLLASRHLPGHPVPDRHGRLPVCGELQLDQPAWASRTTWASTASRCSWSCSPLCSRWWPSWAPGTPSRTGGWPSSSASWCSRPACWACSSPWISSCSTCSGRSSSSPCTSSSACGAARAGSTRPSSSSCSPSWARCSCWWPSWPSSGGTAKNGGPLTFDILALQQAGFRGSLGHLVVRRLLHRLRHQGAHVPGAHLAPRRPHRGAHGRLGHPGRRAAEDGGLRHDPLLHRVLPRGGGEGHGAGADPIGHRRGLRGGHVAGAARHEAAGGLFLGEPHGVRHRRAVHVQPAGHRRLGAPDGQPRGPHRRPVHDGGLLLRPHPHPH